MGHRHFYSASPMFESDPDQNWNHMQTQQHYMHLGIVTVAKFPLCFWFISYISMVNILFFSHQCHIDLISYLLQVGVALQIVVLFVTLWKICPQIAFLFHLIGTLQQGQMDMHHQV